MRSTRPTFRVCAVAAAFVAATAAYAPAGADTGAPAGVTAAQSQHPAVDEKHVGDNLDGPFSQRQEELRQEALREVLAGRKKLTKNDGSKVVKLGDKKYVELGRERTDKIFTILAEFGDQIDERYGGDPGPAHNEIAEPDRTQDNSTAWQADYNRTHFQDIYFGTGEGPDGEQVHSLKTYYEKASSGRYSVEGEVSDWVRVSHNEARYGTNSCGSTVCSTAWDLIRDGVNAWVADEKAQGKTDEQIKADLAQFDVWDRYDHDGDGDFNESDGYLDHFQIVHAGEDESAGGGAQGEDALWAHRWYAYANNSGATGPDGNKAGGTEIGDTGIWVGDYTMQPENGGLGVFAHEYGHDLGLPDLYDTTGAGDNSVGFWSLMSSGSWLGTGKDRIGDLPGDMTSWDKLQLGWLDYAEAKAATASTHTLGFSEFNTDNPQALVVELPKKAVTTTVATPPQGEKQWWSDMGDNLKNTLTRSVDLTGATSATLSLKGWWDIEENFDYLYAEVSTDGGANWTPLDGTANGTAIPRDGGDHPALTGVSDGYQELVYPLDAQAGQQIDLRFRYATDGGVAQKGFAADDLTITADGAPVFSDGAEDDDNGWTAVGFSRIGESFTEDYDQYYIAENRQYVSYDTTLEVGPYNFGSAARPEWVEHFPYQNGVMVWLWDTSQTDNNTSVHPGEGLILPVDAHPDALEGPDGTVLRNRIQSYDSSFGQHSTDALTLHSADVPLRIPSLPGASVFDDHNGSYWSEANPTGSVKVPDTGTQIKIGRESGNGSTVIVEVAPAS